MKQSFLHRSMLRPFHSSLRCLLAPMAIVCVSITPAGADTEVFVDATLVDLVFHNEGQIFWRKGCFADDPTWIKRKPTGSVSESTVFDSLDCVPNSPRSELGLDSSFAYWVTHDGRVVRKSWGTYGSPIELVSNTNDISGMLVWPKCQAADNYVYWHESTGEFNEDSKIYRHRKDGTGSRTLERNLGTDALQQMFLRGDNDIIYLSGSEGDYDLRVGERRLLINGFTWDTTFVAGNVQGFAVGNGRIYFSRIVSGNVQIRSVSLADPAGTEIIHHTISGGIQPNVTQLTVSTDYLFWHEVRSGMGSLRRLRLLNSAIDTVALDIPDSATFVNDGYHVYWNQSETRICRAELDADPVIRDLEARGLEIVQVIQNENNDVPLVIGKTTFVRLYARIGAASSGVTSVAGWPMAVLHGELPDGTPLPGSPITHQSGRQIIDTNDPVRENGEGFMFRLPEEWVNEPQIVLRGEINPGQVFAEPNYANNTSEETVTFQRRAPICVHVLPCDIRNHIRGATYEPWMQPLFDRAEVMLPTSDLRVYFPGGAPIRELDILFPFPPIFDLNSFEFSDTDDDSWKMLVELSLRFPFTSVPRDCWDLNARNHYCVMAPGFSNRPLNGVAYGPQVLVWSTASFSDFDFNSSIGGVTFAHELGHNYDRDHVDCPAGDPADPDPSYPYDDCNIGPSDNEFLGHDPISRNLIVFDEAGDLMSYAHRQNPSRPRWPSDYTYEAILSEIAIMPASRPSPPPPPGIIPVSKRLVVGGRDALKGEYEIWHTYIVTGEALSQANALYNSEGNRLGYQLRSYDAGGKLTETVQALFPDTHEGNDASFIALMEPDPGISRIDLVPTLNPLLVLDSLAAGSAAPTITVTRPTLGEVVDGRLTVEWTGKDSDRNDVLYYLVRFSHDNGTTWRTLETNTPYETLVIDTAGLPGGTKCLVEVIATDGIRTASDRSDPFRLLMKNPQPHIFFIGATGGDCAGTDTFFASTGESIILRGTAYDDEDGPLEGGLLSWNVQGAQQVNGVGEELELHSLRSGVYDITLSAVDSDQNQGTATATLIVDPKFIEEAGISPALELDGRLDDNAYIVRDRYSLSLRNEDSGQLAEVRMVHDDGALYVAIGGLPVQEPGVLFDEYVAIQFDLNNSDSARPQIDDVQYRLFSDDGRIATYHGNGSFFVEDATPDPDVHAVVYRTGDFWNAEFCIETSALGGWSGQTVGVRLVHANSTIEGENAAWPDGSAVWDSATWGDLVFGPHPSDPYDSDGDGLPDQWERDHFGTIAFNGSGNHDHDNLTDREEYVFGTDPNDPGSTFEITWDALGSGDFQLRWPSAAERAYTVYRSTDLRSWEALIRLQDATPPLNTWSDPDPPAGSAYYLVEGHVCR